MVYRRGSATLSEFILPDLVSVVMPVYNAAAFVREAAESVLAQTWRELELVAINDGSRDGSAEILEDLAARDRRVRVMHQENAGAVAALNRGLDLAATHGPHGFVAIMHSDDKCLPTRLERQVAYLTAHPHIDFCGTSIQTFGAANDQRHFPEDPRFTKPFLLFWCCFAHPTMMWRRHVLAEGLRYDPAIPMPCEDYALWVRASQRYQMANVPEVLLRYRVHPAQGGTVNSADAARLTEQIRREQLSWLGIVPKPTEMALHQRLAESALGEDLAFVTATQAWLEKLWQANAHSHYYDTNAFNKVLGGRWAATCIHAATREPLKGGTSNGQTPNDIWKLFWNSPLAPFVNRQLTKNRSIPDHTGF